MILRSLNFFSFDSSVIYFRPEDSVLCDIFWMYFIFSLRIPISDAKIFPTRTESFSIEKNEIPQRKILKGLLVGTVFRI
ncbi:MAG: hypothetical protein RIR26_1039 [Pseudomonadota bacterium]|jgi:hypothetical protein